MSWNVFHRQRAERFAQLLEEANGGRRHHVRSRVDSDLAQPLAIGQRLRDLQPTVEVDPDFRASLRAMLVATAEREGIGATARDETLGDEDITPAVPARDVRTSRPPASQTRIRPRGVIVVSVAVGAIAVSGMAAASENAVPGDALYGMKRHTERAQLALASSDLSRGQLFLDFARTRLAEATALGSRSVGFTAVLDDMDADTRQGIRLLTTAAAQRRDTAALDAVDAFLAEQRPRLAALRVGAGRAAQDRTERSLTLLEVVQRRTDALRAALACGIGTAGRADSIGPVPRTCPTGRGPDTTTPANPSVSGGTGTRPPGEPPRTPERTAPAGDPAPAPGTDQPPVREKPTTSPPAAHRSRD